MQRAPARSAGANLSAEDLQRRLLAIGNAAKARNPDGFVDELKRRVGPSGDDDDDDLETVAAPAAPPAPAASWFCLEPGTRLEKALAHGDTRVARRVRAEATATLWKIAGDGALTDAWCRSLVREGADVGAVFADAEAAAKMLDSPWTKDKFHCVGYLALAAPHAAAADAGLFAAERDLKAVWLEDPLEGVRDDLCSLFLEDTTARRCVDEPNQT